MSSKLKGVIEHPRYKKGAQFKCHLPGEDTVDAIECRKKSGNSTNMEVCVASGCKSIWRACKTCARGRGVASQTDIIDRDSGLCIRHQGVPERSEERKPRDGGNIVSIRSAVKRKAGVHGNTKVTFDELRSLLEDVLQTRSEPFEAHVDEIERFTEQPRELFNQESLLRLGESIKVGQLYPVFVRRLREDEVLSKSGTKYQIIDGERRWRGAKAVGKATIIIVVLEVSSIEVQFAISAMANFGREGHTPIEEARSLRRLLDLGLSLQEAAKMFSMSHTAAHGRLELLDLDESLHEFLVPEEDGKRTPLLIKTARYVGVTLKNHPQLQREVVETSIRKRLSYTQTERIVHTIMQREGLEVPTKKSSVEGPAHLRKKIERLFRSLRNAIDGTLALPDDVLSNNDFSEADFRSLEKEAQSLYGDVDLILQKIRRKKSKSHVS